jgi:hypothetical protein
MESVPSACLPSAVARDFGFQPRRMDAERGRRMADDVSHSVADGDRDGPSRN